MNGEQGNLIVVGVIIPVSYLFVYIAKILEVLEPVHRDAAIPLTAMAWVFGLCGPWVCI